VIVYLHGFRSSPASRKATMLRETMAARGRAGEYLCPALPASPARSVELVLTMVRDLPLERLALIGSSLGGYYATWLAERLGCPAVLLNPAIRPQDGLASYIGVQPVYFSEAQIDFRREYLDELAAIDTPTITRPERYLLLAATGDAVIDYRTMVQKYQGARQHVIAGSDHELSDFTNFIDEVIVFCDACTKDNTRPSGEGQ
jgi:predicted esterase YcpF (UPF0227 family)